MIMPPPGDDYNMFTAVIWHCNRDAVTRSKCRTRSVRADFKQRAFSPSCNPLPRHICDVWSTRTCVWKNRIAPCSNCMYVCTGWPNKN